MLMMAFKVCVLFFKQTATFRMKPDRIGANEMKEPLPGRPVVAAPFLLSLLNLFNRQDEGLASLMCFPFGLHHDLVLLMDQTLYQFLDDICTAAAEAIEWEKCQVSNPPAMTDCFLTHTKLLRNQHTARHSLTFELSMTPPTRQLQSIRSCNFSHPLLASCTTLFRSLSRAL